MKSNKIYSKKSINNKPQNGGTKSDCNNVPSVRCANIRTFFMTAKFFIKLLKYLNPISILSLSVIYCNSL